MLSSHVQGTPQFRAHASKILNSFDYVIDALDKDPDMKEIAKMVAEGEHHIDFFKKPVESYLLLLDEISSISNGPHVCWIIIINLNVFQSAEAMWSARSQRSRIMNCEKS